MAKFAADIQVVCEARDGWTLYTSPELPGLFISSRNDREAYEDLPLAIKTLIELEHDTTVSVAHKCSYETFIAKIVIGDQARQEMIHRTEELCSGHVIPFTVTNSIRSNELKQ